MARPKSQVVARLLVVVLSVALLATLFAVFGDLRGALPGDNYRDIYYINRADVPVLVYERQPTRTSPPHRVAPGRTFHNQVLVPFVRDLSTVTASRRFEATTEAGEIIYCRTLTYRELEGLTWQLAVDRTMECP